MDLNVIPLFSSPLVVKKLDKATIRSTLQTLIYWQKEVLGYNAVLKR